MPFTARSCWTALVVSALVASLPGCGGGPAPRPDGEAPGRRLIDAPGAVSAYNARAQRITSLWARASVVLEGEDAEGRDLRERAEGHFQIEPPAHLALTLGKVGETHLYFGSNDRYYWWFDMTESDRKVASFGRHELVTPEKTDRLGVPIHPVDLIDMLGITVLPADPGQVVARAGDEPGTVVLAAATRDGVRVHTVDAETFEPNRVRLVGPGGRVLLDVELSRYRLMAGLEPEEAPLRVPERIIVRMAGFEGEIRFSLHEPTRRDIRPIAFDVEKLIGVYRIPDVIDLDAPPPPDGSAGGPAE